MSHKLNAHIDEELGGGCFVIHERPPQTARSKRTLQPVPSQDVSLQSVSHVADKYHEDEAGFSYIPDAHRYH